MTTYFALAAALALIYCSFRLVTRVNNIGEHIDTTGGRRSATGGGTVALRPMLGDEGTDARPIPELAVARALGFDGAPTWPYVEPIRRLTDAALRSCRTIVDMLAAMTARPSPRATAA